MTAAGLMRGYDDGTFGPDDTLTRAQLAVVIARTLSLPFDSAATTTFSDDTTIPAWAKAHIAAAVKAASSTADWETSSAPTRPATASKRRRCSAS